MRRSLFTKVIIAGLLAFSQCGFISAEETEDTFPDTFFEETVPADNSEETPAGEDELSEITEEVTETEETKEEGSETEITEPVREEELPGEEEMPEDELAAEEETENTETEEQPAEEEEASAEEMPLDPEPAEMIEVPEETEIPEEDPEEAPLEEAEEGSWATGEMYEEQLVKAQDFNASNWNIYTGTKSYTYRQTEARRILKLVNNFRTSGKAWLWNSDNKTKTTNIKVDALQYDTALEDIAMQRAAEISIYMSHTRPDASYCFSAYYEYNGRSYTAGGENILYGTGSFGATAESSFDLWKEENEKYDGQGHRRNMLNAKYTALGIGYACVNGMNFWVMELGYKTVVPDTSPLDGSMKRQIPVCTDLISSVTDMKAKPSPIRLGVGELADLPDVTAKVRVSAFSGDFTMSNAYPYYGSAAIAEEYSSIITLTDDHQIQGLALGDAKLDLSFGTGSALKKLTVPVSVVIRAESIALDRTEMILDRDTSFRLTASVLPENASDKSVTWASSDRNVAAVSSDGTVTGKGAGTAVITATTNDGGFAASCTVKVEVHVTGVELELENYIMREEMTEPLQYRIMPADAEDQSVSWQSDDPDIVSVDDNGVITALKEGTAAVTVTTADRGKTDSVMITVRALNRAEMPYLTYYKEDGSQVSVYDGASAEVKKGTLLRLASDTGEAEITYSTGGIIKTYVSPFAAEEDMEIRAVADHSGMKTSEKAVITIHIKDGSVSADPGDLTEEDILEVNEKYGGIVPDGIWAAGMPEETVYTGTKITFPGLRIYDHKTLLDSRSYSAVYKNNTNVNAEAADTPAGWTPPAKTKIPYVQITGKGSYSGKTYIPFNITAKSLDDETVSVSDLWIKTTGKVLRPLPVITANGKKLTVNKDYSVVYTDGAGNEHSYQDGITEAGSYSVILTGMNNYQGKRTVSLTAESSPEVVLMAKAGVTVSAWKAADGLPVTAQTPLAVTVKNGKKTFSPDTYRVVEIRNGEKCGSASAVIEGTGIPDEKSGQILKGRKTVTFRITGTSLKNAKAVIPSAAYTGEEIRPSGFEVKLGDTILLAGTDYDILSYSKNISASAKASVKIGGKGIYTGTKTFTFTIAKADLADVSVHVAETAQYRPAGAIPETELVYLGKTLKAGKDYTVKYTNNKKAGNTGTVTFTGKGSFKGTFGPVMFEVGKRPLSSLSLSVSDIPYSSAKKGSYYKPKIVLKDGKKTLGAKDLDLGSAAWTYVYDTRVRQYAKNNNGKFVLRMAGDAVGVNDVPAEGTLLELSVPASETGNYTGSVSKTYKVIAPAYSLAKATVRFNVMNSDGTVSVKKTLTKPYTGSPVTVSEEELYITVKKNGSTYVLQPDEYEIISYSSNIKKGTAKMTIRGTGDFGGKKTVSFTVGARRMELKEILFSLAGVLGR